jgi:transposase
VHCATKRNFYKATSRRRQDCFVATCSVSCPALLRNSPQPKGEHHEAPSHLGSPTRGDDARGDPGRTESSRGRPRQMPVRVMADKAYDSDPLRKRLQRRGITLICPHKKNRVRPATQDGRTLRRYQRRWIVERTNGWLGNFRRLVVRYDRSLTIYGAFFHIACFMIVLRRVVQ